MGAATWTVLLAGLLLSVLLHQSACEGASELPSASNGTGRSAAGKQSDVGERPSAPGLASSQPLSKLQRQSIRRYLEGRGISIQDIPKALVVYESISMALL